MQNIILVVHLLLALLLIGAVLLQRSEGGALGIGGGGGNVMSGRGAATALQKATWGLAAAFIATSMALTLFAIDQAQDRGLGLGEERPAAENGEPAPALGEDGLIDLTPGGGAPEPGAGAEGETGAGAEGAGAGLEALEPEPELPSLPDLGGGSGG